MRFRAQVIGTLNLFRPEPGLLDDHDLAGAQVMADVAAISILQERTLREARVLAEQVQRGTYARTQNRRLHNVSTAVISSLLTIEELASPSKTSPMPHATNG